MASVLNCIESTRKPAPCCTLCEKELRPNEPVFGITLFIQNDAGFDTMIVRRFCSFACKMNYRERVEQEIELSPRFRLGEFETKIKEMAHE